MAKRRGNHEGHYRPLPSGNWNVLITIDGRRISMTEPSKTELKRKVRLLQQQMERGLTYDAARTTFGEWFSDWFETHATSLRDHTRTNYRRLIERCILPNLRNVKIKDLTAPRLQRFINQLHADGVGVRSIQLCRSIIHTALADAMRSGLVASNQADRRLLKIPRREKATRQVWDENQCAAFLLAIRGHRNEHFYHLAIHTGMRISELLGLQWPDVDFVNRRLFVRQQLIRLAGGGWKFMPPKSASGIRPIALGTDAVEALRAQQAQLAGDRWEEHDLVFPNTIGKPQAGNLVGAEFKKLAARAGLPQIRFHDIRHTSLTLLIASGEDLETVAQRAGHHSAVVTLGTYGHALPGRQQAAADKLDQLIKPIEIKLDTD
jgi:integrase